MLLHYAQRFDIDGILALSSLEQKRICSPLRGLEEDRVSLSQKVESFIRWNVFPRLTAKQSHGDRISHRRTFSTFSDFDSTTAVSGHSPFYLPSIPFINPLPISTPPYSLPRASLNMSSRVGLRFYRAGQVLRSQFRQPLQRRMQTTTADAAAEQPAQSNFQKFLNSPVGPRTVHFW